MTARHAYNLGFISDEDIYNHVRQTVELYRTTISLRDFNSNIVDPIKLTFDAKVYGKSIESLIEDECFRQKDKTNSNHIGYFHQNLFQFADGGWEVPANGITGFDVQNPQRHIYAELKNKHNTMNAAAIRSTYIRMQDVVLHDKEAMCLLVEYNTDVSKDEKWEVAVSTGNFSNERIRFISIDKFYEMVFGDEKAFKRLCDVLPQIIDDVLECETKKAC